MPSDAGHRCKYLLVFLHRSVFTTTFSPDLAWNPVVQVDQPANSIRSIRQVSAKISSGSSMLFRDVESWQEEIGNFIMDHDRAERFVD